MFCLITGLFIGTHFSLGPRVVYVEGNSLSVASGHPFWITQGNNWDPLAWETFYIHLRCSSTPQIWRNVEIQTQNFGALPSWRKVPLKEFFAFLFKKGRDFIYCVYRGSWIQVGGGTGCLCAGSDPLMLLAKGWWEGTELGPFKASPLSCPDDANHSGAEQGSVLSPLRRD